MLRFGYFLEDVFELSNGHFGQLGLIHLDILLDVLKMELYTECRQHLANLRCEFYYGVLYSDKFIRVEWFYLLKASLRRTKPSLITIPNQ